MTAEGGSLKQTTVGSSDDVQSSEISPLDERHTRTSQPKSNHFVRFTEWDREDQLQAFFAWLPKELHETPGIEWTTFPPELMGYCVRTVGESLYAASLAMAAASALGAIDSRTLLSLIGNLDHLLRILREICQMQQISDLATAQIWQEFLSKTEHVLNRRAKVQAYASVTTKHFPAYLQRLDPRERARMQVYALPTLPYDFLHKHFPYRRALAAQQARRKAHSDILVPLYPVLRQLVRFRQQLALRVLSTIREARRKVEEGSASLPFPFAHSDSIPEVNRDARTVSEVQIGGREVTMKLILWDKRTWVRDHRDNFSLDVINEARAGRGAYTAEQNTLFVQFDGPPNDLLWFGDLIEYRLLQQFQMPVSLDAEYHGRWQFAKKLGFTNGCHCYRPGLLGSSDKWFAESARAGDLLFEPESLYRGILFGAALAMIALSNGSRLSELLQVSWNKERRITRTEIVTVLGEDGLPQLGTDGKPLTKHLKIHLQHLLPKGAKTEEERQLFPLSKECMRLLGEIKQMLEETHGCIPLVSPSRSSTKYEHLKPERYLFQWAAESSGKHGILSVTDVQMLLRFILHGLDLSTTQGEPIRVTAHLLRHVMATHARQYRHVPAEAIAHFFLHHRLKERTGHVSSPAEISAYYFQMTEEQRFAIIGSDLDEQEEIDRVLLPSSLPTPRDLEQMNEDLRVVYEQWHTLHPTALGNCGCPGLCPRGNDRALCLGCSYLVTDAEKGGVALTWRTSYAKQAELLEAQGNSIDARQARIKVQQLDDVMTIMRLQLQAESNGSYIPLHKVLPSAYRGVS